MTWKTTQEIRTPTVRYAKTDSGTSLNAKDVASSKRSRATPVQRIIRHKAGKATLAKWAMVILMFAEGANNPHSYDVIRD
jgi:hypothetical protein